MRLIAFTSLVGASAITQGLRQNPEVASALADPQGIPVATDAGAHDAGADVEAAPAVATPAPASEKQCRPACNWSCSNPSCEEVCTPSCTAPSCETRCQPIELESCTTTCGDPKCHVICPASCKGEDCAGCQTVCSEPECETKCAQNCKSVCQEPTCQWHCDTSTDCPKPVCALNCETCDGTLKFCSRRQIQSLKVIKIERFYDDRAFSVIKNHPGAFSVGSTEMPKLDGVLKATGQATLGVLPFTFQHLWAIFHHT
jgi:hypothetical protein